MSSVYDRSQILKCHIINPRNDLESHLTETPFWGPCFVIWKYIFWPTCCPKCLGLIYMLSDRVAATNAAAIVELLTHTHTLNLKLGQVNSWRK